LSKGPGQKKDELDEKPRAFVLVESKKETETFLQEGVRTFASTILWTKNQETVINTYLTSLDPDHGEIFVWLPKEVDPVMFRTALLKSGNLDIYFSVSISRANLFFKAELLGFEPGAFRFKFPREVYKVQRRKDFRLPVPDGYTVYVDLPDPTLKGVRYKRKILDISAGGIAVLGTLEEEAVYAVGQKLENVKFKLRTRDITIHCEVRYVKSYSITGKNLGVKIGLQFINLKNSEAQFIAAYVFEESRKYLTKFL
jgi:hypothetical protein